MRVVVDANVLVSFLLTRGETIASLFDLWEREKFTLLMTPEIILEVTQVVERFVAQGVISSKAASALMARLKKNSKLVVSLSRVSISPDKKDNRYLAGAKDGKAKYLVTGDKKHLLPLEKFAQTKIVSPGEFVRIFFLGKRSYRRQ